MARVLVVEDNELIRRLLRQVLSEAGHAVQTASGAGEALAEIMNKDKHFDLILCDIEMPVMNGHELTRRIAIHCPRTRILHMTGYDPGCGDCPYKTKCPVIAKPFVIDEVLATVNRALENPPNALRT